jgi:YHS domain-containing protein
MQDPVCGMTVDQASAAAAWEHDGRVYLFCSVGCMERFRRDPDGFLALDDDRRHM